MPDDTSAPTGRDNASASSALPDEDRASHVTKVPMIQYQERRRSHTLKEQDGVAPASIADPSAARWDHVVARDYARVHLGHTYVQNHYNIKREDGSEHVGDTGRRIDFMEALEFDQRDNRYNSIETAHGDTCQWLFQKTEYIWWRTSQRLDVHHGFLWIKGKAGSGKSTMMKCAYKHAMSNSDKANIISFFFNARGHQLEQSVEGMYRSLILQLVQIYPDLRIALPTHSPYRGQQQTWEIPILRNYFAQCILTLSCSESVTLFIDALDECDEDEMRETIEHLEELCALAVAKRSPVRICLASRYYPRISIRKCMELDLKQQPEHLQDIRAYIDHKLAIRDTEFKSLLAARIAAQSSGAFLWVVLVVRSIRKQYDRGASQSELLQALGNVPGQLSALIVDIMRSPDDALLCTMRWLLCATRPLALEELYSAIRAATRCDDLKAIELDRDSMEAFVLTCSRGLVELTYYKRLTKRVQLVHESVREHIFSGGLVALRACSEEVSIARNHATLFEECQRYLNLYANKHVAVLEEHDSDIQARDDKRYPLLRYALSNVLSHLEVAFSAGILGLDSLHQLPIKHFIKCSALLAGNLLAIADQPACLLQILMRHGCQKLAVAFFELHAVPRAFAETQGPKSAGPISQGFGNLSKWLPLAVGMCPGLVELLLDQGADINASSGEALRTAVARADFDMIKTLLSRGADARIFFGQYITVLTFAVSQNDLKCVKMLLEHGADANAVHFYNGITPLLGALGQIDRDTKVSYGAPLWTDHDREAMICALLSYGADVNLEAGPWGISPLQFAIERWGEKMFRLLLDCTISDANLSSILLVYAAQWLNLEVLTYLLTKEIHAKSKAEALQEACFAPDCATSTWTREVLRFSAGEARVSIVQLLLNAGADPKEIEGECEPAMVTSLGGEGSNLAQRMIECTLESPRRDKTHRCGYTTSYRDGRSIWLATVMKCSCSRSLPSGQSRQEFYQSDV